MSLVSHKFGVRLHESSSQLFERCPTPALITILPESPAISIHAGGCRRRGRWGVINVLLEPDSSVSPERGLEMPMAPSTAKWNSSIDHAGQDHSPSSPRCLGTATPPCDMTT